MTYLLEFLYIGSYLPPRQSQTRRCNQVKKQQLSYLVCSVLFFSCNSDMLTSLCYDIKPAHENLVLIAYAQKPPLLTNPTGLGLNFGLSLHRCHSILEALLCDPS